MQTSFTVEAGHVLTFARAIGEPPTDSGGLVPPTFTVCSVQQDPSHMCAMKPAGALGYALTLPGTVLHAEQRFEYLEAVRVGDRLSVTESFGRSWEKANRDGGVLRFIELVKELHDPSGALVVRSTMTLVCRTPAEDALA